MCIFQRWCCRQIRNDKYRRRDIVSRRHGFQSDESSGGLELYQDVFGRKCSDDHKKVFEINKKYYLNDWTDFIHILLVLCPFMYEEIRILRGSIVYIFQILY